MLDEVDRVDVPPPNRVPYGLDGRCMVGRGPGPLPLPDLQLLVTFVVISDISIALAPAEAGRERPRARLGGDGASAPPDRRREPVAEIQVGHERLASGDEESLRAEPRLDAPEGAVGLVDLEHGQTLLRSCRIRS